MIKTISKPPLRHIDLSSVKKFFITPNLRAAKAKNMWQVARMTEMTNQLACKYASECSGCDWIHLPYDRQRAQKINDLASHLERAALSDKLEFFMPVIRWIETAPGHMRTRMDLTIETATDQNALQSQQVSGLYSQDRHQLVDLENCAQLTPELDAWLLDFRKVKLNVRRGSVRLRVSPMASMASQRGVWLDFANVDIKRLLDERTALDQLRQSAVVEIGQKRKRLVDRAGTLKLADPVFENWFETYDADGASIPLHSTIGTFTQPGPIANRALVKEVLLAMQADRPLRIAEFGSGIGNFTLPLASIAEEVRAFEIDPLAIAGLQLSLAASGLDKKVQVFSGNFQISRTTPPALENLDAILVDPPRSGIGHFLDPIETMPAIQRPTIFVYVSCFAESFALDSRRLAGLGYRMMDVAIVDQFPQSRHYEIVSRFER